ncbi:hypothetical protein ACX9R5_16425 [Rathayibacter sp. CAU 1779]
MKELIFCGTPVLIGDEAADTLVAYAATLNRVGRSDNVELRALTTEGHDISVRYLLNSAATLMTQSTTMAALEPNNRQSVRYMKAAQHRLDPPLDEYAQPNTAE